MARASLIPFQVPRRERCSLCRKRQVLPYLLLLKAGEEVAGEMDLCSRRAHLLGDVFLAGGAGPEHFSEGG